MTNKKVDKKASKELVTNIYKLHKTIDESRDYIHLGRIEFRENPNVDKTNI